MQNNLAVVRNICLAPDEPFESGIYYRNKA